MVAEALQRAIFAALRADAELAAIFGGVPRVFDAVPAPNQNEPEAEYRRRVPHPYITIGDDEIVDDSTTCARAYEATTRVHVWSRGVGRPEAKRIGDRIALALDATLSVTGFVCTEHEFRNARYFRNPDGLTTHGVIEHRFLLDPA